MLSSEDFRKVAEMRDQAGFTDEELQLMIDVTSRITSYLEGRKDAGLLLMPLRLELESYRGFQNTRKTERRRHDSIYDKEAYAKT